MEGLKDFTIFTKKLLSSADTYNIILNGEHLGFGEKLMVENAGYAISEELRRRYKNKKILFVCGVGGKGAIGLSAARHLIGHASVRVVIVGEVSGIKNKSMLMNYQIVKDLIEVYSITDSNTDDIRRHLRWSDMVVDAIIGIGLVGRLSGLLYRTIKAVNGTGKNVISIDIPSGIDPDSGAPNIAAIRARQVFVIHKQKSALKKYNADSSIIVDIGLPASIELFSGPGDVKAAVEKQRMDTNKYERGSVLIIGGSEDYRGAPLLSAFGANNTIAALRGGAGYVTVFAPDGIVETISSKSPEIIAKGFDEADFGEKDMERLRSIRHNALVIGPGLSEKNITFKVVSEIVKYEKERHNSIVIDATAIKVMAAYKNFIDSNMVVTPHYGEFKALSGVDVRKYDLGKRINAAIDFAKDNSCILVLKGNETIITNGDLVKINRSKSPALATMGTGDVLSGIIAAFASSHKNLFESAVAGVYVHSYLGDKLFDEKGMHVIATDIIDALPSFLKNFDVITGV